MGNRRDGACGRMRVSRENVAYLALEGGGGKGVAYLGAIRALETMKILPIDINQPGKNRVLGISGSSAGAITALLLGLGLTSSQLEAVLQQSSTFNGFFDGPDPGRYRLVDSRGRSGIGGKSRQGGLDPVKVSARLGMVPAPYGPALAIPAAIVNLVLSQLPPALGRPIRNAPREYLDNLLKDRGLFPGFASRQFFQDMLTRYLSPRIVARARGDAKKVYSAASVGFAKFYELTGVDLVITGVNVSTARPAMFSRRLTPDFPVADAVSISMGLPVIFKPAYVDVEVPVNAFNKDPLAYRGFWVDGGVLNNLPIHAFDANFMDEAKAGSFTEELNPQMVALRLTPGFPPGSGPPTAVDPDSIGLSAFLGMFGDAILYPSESGQLRTAGEAEQTIDLYTYKLETTDFAPPKEKSEPAIKYAEQRVLQDFNPGTGGLN